MLEKKKDDFHQQQSEEAVASAKALVRAISIAGSSADSLVLAVDHLIEVASHNGHPEMTLFRDLRAQAYVPGGPSFSQICLYLLFTGYPAQ